VGTFVLVFGGCGSAVLVGEKIGFLGSLPYMLAMASMRSLNLALLTQ
jgi:hypothetical protein